MTPQEFRDLCTGDKIRLGESGSGEILDVVSNSAKYLIAVRVITVDDPTEWRTSEVPNLKSFTDLRWGMILFHKIWDRDGFVVSSIFDDGAIVVRTYRIPANEAINWYLFARATYT